jgi:hypothetical protein
MSGCRFEIIEEETPVYFNDFSGGALEGLGGNPKLWQFNGKNVLGPYNRDGFSLTLNNLPKHRIISISIDLYIQILGMVIKLNQTDPIYGKYLWMIRLSLRPRS